MHDSRTGEDPICGRHHHTTQQTPDARRATRPQPWLRPVWRLMITAVIALLIGGQAQAAKDTKRRKKLPSTRLMLKLLKHLPPPGKGSGILNTKPSSRPTSRPATARATAPKKPKLSDPAPRPTPPKCPHMEGNVCFHWTACWRGNKSHCKKLKEAYDYEPSLAKEIDSLFATTRRKCIKDDVDACKYVIQRLAKGIGRKADLKAATKYAITACQSTPAICPEIERLHKQAKAQHPKWPWHSIYKRSCLWDHYPSCFRWAQKLEGMLLFSPRLQRNIETAYRKSCKGKYAKGCYYLGLLHLRRTSASPLPPGQKKRAVGTMAKGCRLKHPKACQWLMKASLWGDGVQRSCGYAQAFHRRSLGGNVTSQPLHHCAGLPTSRAALPQRSEPTALRKLKILLRDDLRTQCTRSRPGACLILGDLYWERQFPNTPPELAMTAYEKSCQRQNPLGCIRLMSFLTHHPELKPLGYDPRQSLRAFCKAGSGHACTALAHYMLRNDSIQGWFLTKKLYETYMIPMLYEEGCQRGDGRACRLLAKATPAQRAMWLKKACRNHDGPGCLLLANAQLGAQKALPKSPKKRVQLLGLLQRSCDLLHLEGCAALAHHAATLFTSPHRAQRVAHEATRLACLRRHKGACLHRARQLLQQSSLAARQAARALAERGCKTPSHTEPMCGLLHVIKAKGLGGEWMPENGRAALATYCKQKPERDPQSCHVYGGLLLRGIGGNVARKAGLKLLSELCQKGYQPSCVQWARQLHRHRHTPHKEALQVLKASCLTHKHIPGCLAWDRLLALGPHAKKAPAAQGTRYKAWRKQTRKRLQQQCKRLQPLACHRWGQINELGWGSSPSNLKARNAYQLACRLGHQDSCIKLGMLLRRLYGTKGWGVAIRLCKQKVASVCLSLAERMLESWKQSYRTFKRYRRSRYRYSKRYARRARKYRKHMFDLYKLACQKGIGAACSTLGTLALKGTRFFSLMEKSKSKARRWLRRACDLQHGAGCWHLKTLLATSAKASTLNNLASQSCRFGYKQACPSKQPTSPAPRRLPPSTKKE